MTIHTIIRRRHFARLITKTTDTNSEYLIFIALQRQQLLGERASILSCTYIACLVDNFTAHLCARMKRRRIKSNWKRS